MADSPAIVDPLIVAIGTPVHVTPIDQDGNDIPITDSLVFAGKNTNTTNSISDSLVTISYDATGAIVTAVNPGTGTAVWRYTPAGGGAAIESSVFTVQVPTPISAIGDKVP